MPFFIATLTARFLCVSFSSLNWFKWIEFDGLDIPELKLFTLRKRLSFDCFPVAADVAIVLDEVGLKLLRNVLSFLPTFTSTRPCEFPDYCLLFIGPWTPSSKTRKTLGVVARLWTCLTILIGFFLTLEVFLTELARFWSSEWAMPPLLRDIVAVLIFLSCHMEIFWLSCAAPE